MAENKRDPQADLELCEAATPGPWNTRVPQHNHGHALYQEDSTQCDPICVFVWWADTDSPEPEMSANSAFVEMAREALPWYIRAYLAQREEIERLKSAALAEAHARVREEVLGNLSHLGVTPHCDWQGHSVGQVVGCEVSALQMELEGVYAGIDQHGMEALNRQLQCQREELEQLRSENDSLHVVLQEANDTIGRMSREQSEESALARLRAWVDSSPFLSEVRHTFLHPFWRFEIARTTDEGYRRVEVQTPPPDREPLVNERYHEIFIGTEDKPATFAEMVDAALAEWERKYKGDEAC